MKLKIANHSKQQVSIKFVKHSKLFCIKLGYDVKAFLDQKSKIMHKSPIILGAKFLYLELSHSRK